MHLLVWRPRAASDNPWQASGVLLSAEGTILMIISRYLYLSIDEPKAGLIKSSLASWFVALPMGSLRKVIRAENSAELPIH